MRSLAGIPMSHHHPLHLTVHLVISGTEMRGRILPNNAHPNPGYKRTQYDDDEHSKHITLPGNAVYNEDEYQCALNLFALRHVRCFSKEGWGTTAPHTVQILEWLK